MKPGKSIATWCIVATLGYAIGWWLLRGISPQDGSSILKACATIFGAASFSLALIFRIVDTAPPKELDEERQERWTKLFSNRWNLLWVRWLALIGATLTTSLAFAALDGNLSLISERVAIGLGTASVLVGVIGIVVSIYEITAIRKTIQQVSKTLKDAKKVQNALNRLEGPNAESDKTAKI